ncbi:ABC transporter permease [Pararhizobium mangrovi]|uniref:ABC-2 type transporter transmembrane domain-containing protein n=1 Tax=Pararhizobium mangrovi TaxID=2590452 RepID=A0A506U2R1_9HYPH|nr:ABC transporter permease [Pararhizobium mangrovi]TPW27561.1 hypothetical protein FJU11_11255 [Pararhizobium mangrovi]
MATTSITGDLRESFAYRRFWLIFGRDDASAQFQHTSIGGLFFTVSTMIRVAIVYFVFGAALGHTGPSYFGYIAFGFPIFMTISSSISNGYSILKQNRSIINSMRMPIFALVLRFLVSQIIRLGFSLLVFLGFVVLNPGIINQNWIWLLLTIPLFVCTICAIALFCMILGAFFPNIFEFLNSLMRMMMFATPIFWYAASRHGVRGAIALYNPFTHIIAIVREPALGQPLPFLSLAVVVAILVVVGGAGCYMLKRSSEWLIYRI